MSDWIKCRKKLPDSGVEVLIKVAYIKGFEPLLYEEKMWTAYIDENEDWHRHVGIIGYPFIVTHWAPLPKSITSIEIYEEIEVIIKNINKDTLKHAKLTKKWAEDNGLD